MVDRTGKALLVANYTGGTVAALPIAEDGSLGEPASFIQHAGPVADAKRQGSPHAHSINIDSTNGRAIAADLGLDKLLIYRIDPTLAKLTPADPPSASVAPRSGPRHFAFHPDGQHAYVINEISLTVTAFEYDPKWGTLQEIQTIRTIPDNVSDPGFSTAEVQVHPSGKFLYGSNRGHNTIAIFAIDPGTGRLTARGHRSTQGKTPRNFGIDPTGKFLLAANQDSGTIVVLSIDPNDGSLGETGTSIAVPRPVCIKFLVPTP
ncbi:MAG: lactonase family protein [Isosphaeraceae bacterium]